VKPDQRPYSSRARELKDVDRRAARVLREMKFHARASERRGRR